MIQIRLFLVFQVLFASWALAAPPGNDSFAEATVAGPALPATLTGNARDATYQTGEPVLNSELRNGSIWFRWTPSSAGTGFAVPVFTWELVGATKPGSGYEMLVHRGASLAGLSTLARGDEAAPIPRFPYTTGQTYYIQVFVRTTPASATFPWKLVISGTSGPATAPANDAFAAATTISSGAPRSASGTTVAATLESGESITENLTRSVWYRYTSNTNNSRLFSLTPDADDSFPKAEIFTGSSLTTLSRVGWIDSYGETLIPLVNGTTYYIRVFNQDANDYSIPGPFTIDISASPIGASPVNNAFSNATDLGSALNTPVASDTFKSGVESGEKLPMGTSGTVWFKWTAPSSGRFLVQAESLDIPPGVSVWAGSGLANLKLKGSSDWFNPVVSFQASMGETVYFQACGEGGYFFPFDISVIADTEPTTPPRVVSTALNNASVDVTTGDQTVTLSIEIAGSAGGYISAVDLLHPGGGLVDFALTDDFVFTPGTSGNGFYSTTLTIPRGAAAGSYPIVIYLRDGTETVDYLFGSTGLITDRDPLYFFWPTYADIPDGPDFLTVTNSGVADTPPALTSFTVTPSNADVGAAAATVSFSAVITDAQGVDSVSMEWSDPAETLLGDRIDLVRSSGSPLDGSWTGTLTIPRYAAPGRLNLTLEVTDSSGQTRQFGIQPANDGLRDRYFGRLQTMANSTITLNNSVGLDVLPPQISEVTVTPNPATFGSGGTADVAISLRVKDGQSGVDEVYFALGSNPLVLLPRLSGTAEDGIYGRTVTIRRADSGPGVHETVFATYDVSGNEGIFNSPVPGVVRTTLLAPAAGTYNAWAFGFSLAPPLDGPSASAQADGISNALKFAFNLDPTQSTSGPERILISGTGRAGLPNLTITGTGSSTRLRMEYIRRIGSPGLSYTAEFGSSLGGAGAWSPVTGGTVTGIDSQWERVVVEDASGTGAAARFGRVKVVTQP